MDTEEGEFSQTVRVVAAGGQTSGGTVTICRWSNRQRRMRALKACAVAWLLAIPALLIPMLHFVLVPVLIIGGPVAAWWVSRQTAVLLKGFAKCPACGENIELHRATAQWPVFDTCTKCSSALRLLEELP